MQEALFYKKEPVSRARCVLCPHRCSVLNGKAGLCRVRVNRDGSFYSTAYGRVAAYGLDPVEKKPLFHFLPGANLLTYGTLGCTFHCTFCSNHEISQGEASTAAIGPDELVDLAVKSGAAGVAASYSEPVVFYEFAQDTARAARARGLKSVVVTNGFILEEPLKAWLPSFDAMKVDLKGSEVLYREVSGGQQAPVLRTLKLAFDSGVHVEVSCPLIPSLNDYEGDVEALVRKVAEVSPEIPLHWLAYHPAHKMSLDATSGEALEKAYQIAARHLRHVYVGNTVAADMQNTYCPDCKKAVILRKGQGVLENLLKEGKCECGRAIRGVFA